MKKKKKKKSADFEAKGDKILQVEMDTIAIFTFFKYLYFILKKTNFNF